MLEFCLVKIDEKEEESGRLIIYTEFVNAMGLWIKLDVDIHSTIFGIGVKLVQNMMINV